MRRLVWLLLLLAAAASPAAAQSRVQVDNLPSAPASASASLSSTTCPGAGCQPLTVSGYAGFALQVTGTWVGTLTIEGSVDGVTYQALNVTPINGSSPVTTTTGNGVWVGSVAALTSVQARFSAYTSGTAIVSLAASVPGGGGGGGGGGGSSSDVTIHDPNTTTQKVAVNASGQMSITCANCSGSGASAVDESAFTQGTNSVAPAGVLFKTSYTALTTGQVGILRGFSDGSLFAMGSVASGATDAGNPIKIGSVFNTTQPTVTTGQRVDLQATARGAQIVATGVDAFAVNASQTGTWNVTNVSGTVSLPTGASTAAKQPALGTAGSASADVITVQGIASMTALKVDGSAVTQPVSGTVTANQGGTWTVQPGNTANTTAWKVDGSAVTQPVSGTVTANAGTNLNTSALALDASVTTLEVAQASTTSGQKGVVVQGAVTTNAPSYTTAQTDPLSLDTSGLLRASLKDTPSNTNNFNVNLAASAATVTVSGTVTTTPPANASTNVAQFGGVNVSTGTGASGTGIPRVTVANDSNVLATQSGTWTVQPGNTANTTAWKVDGSAVTQPVSGTITANAGSGTFTAAGAKTNNNAAPGATNVGELPAVANAAAPTYTEGNQVALSTDLTGALRVSGSAGGGVAQTQVRNGANAWTDVGYTTGNLTMPVTDASLGQLLNALIAISQQAGYLKGTFGRPVRSTGDALDVNVKYPAASYDPCTSAQKFNGAISQTANAVLLAKPAGRIYLCSLLLVGADAENVSLVEGTGATCGTGTAAVIGSTTAANGPNLAANGGWSQGAGAGATAITNVSGDDLCLFQSGSGRVAGNFTYAIR